MEGRAFLKPEMPEEDDDVIVVFEGKMVELLLRTDPSYEKYVHINQSGKKIFDINDAGSGPYTSKAVLASLTVTEVFFNSFDPKILIYSRSVGLPIMPYNLLALSARVIMRGVKITSFSDTVFASTVEELPHRIS